MLEDFVAADGSSTVAVRLDVELPMGEQPPEVVDAMARHGVIEPLRIFVAVDG
jgi:hypothetical protein